MIRIATEHDADELLRIYAYYVENTAITFEYEVPSLEVFRQRIHHTLDRYPYLVFEDSGSIAGYAYAGAFHERKAYDWAVETTVYVANGARRNGYGRALYESLETALALQRFTNLYACIAYPDVEDEYLSKNSAQFHAHMGYRLAGEFHQCGYKFGRWYNMIWMEKHISDHPDHPLPVLTFDDIRDKFANQYGIR